MKTVDIIESDTQSVMCAGKEIPYDHPQIYLEIDTSIGVIVCPYCQKKFILK